MNLNLQVDWKPSGLNQLVSQRVTVFVADAINQTNKVANDHTTKINSHGTQIQSANQTIQTLSQNNQNNSNRISGSENNINSINLSLNNLATHINTINPSLNNLATQINTINNNIQNLNNQVVAESLSHINFEQATNTVLQNYSSIFNSLEESNKLQQNSLSQLKANFSIEENRIAEIENHSAIVEGRVDYLQGQLIPQIHQAVNQHEKILADTSRFEKLEMQNIDLSKALEKEKFENESTKNSVINLASTQFKLEQQFQAFQEMALTKERRYEEIIEQLNAKIANQAHMIEELSAAAKKAHRLSGEFFIGTKSDGISIGETLRSEEFENRINAKKKQDKFTSKITKHFL